MGQASWLVAGIVPGLERQLLKTLGSDEQALLQLLQRWRNEAAQAGRVIKRLVVAYEAGRDGFWLARWLRRRCIEAYVDQSRRPVRTLGKAPPLGGGFRRGKHWAGGLKVIPCPVTTMHSASFGSPRA